MMRAGPSIPIALQAWRTGYKHHLEERGMSPDQAAALAEKVEYHPELYPRQTLPFDIETSALEKTTPFTKAATRSELKLLDAGSLISMEPPTGADMAFTHAVLCQVGLPRSKVEGREFLRQSGKVWINVQAGFLDEGCGPVLQPIPYGAMPRLALAWISTYAKRKNTRVVPVGESASEFLRMLGQSTSGGARGAFTMLRKQMHALAACRLQLGYMGRTFNGQPVEQFDSWVANKDTNQRAIWPGEVILTSSFHDELMEYGVPLDNRALLYLKGSALALDVYAWLAHRLHRIEGRPVMLYWKSIRDQFAHEYQGKNAEKDFKKSFLISLNSVLVVYPKASVEVVRCGILLKKSPPPIAPKV
jgi:uncharacterized protein YozE (UPF0346 family)